MEAENRKRKSNLKAPSKVLPSDKNEQENSDILNEIQDSIDSPTRKNIKSTSNETRENSKRMSFQESSAKNLNTPNETRENSKRMPFQESSAKNLETRYPNTKNVIKYIPSGEAQEQKSSNTLLYILLAVILAVILFYVSSSSSSPSYDGNIYDLAKHAFPKGNGHISSLEIAEQIANSFRTRSPKRALSLLIVGSQFEDLKNSIFRFGNELCGNVAYLEGKDSSKNFAKDLMDHAKKTKSDHSFVCPIFLINTVGISRENLDMLEQAFDDSQPILRNAHDSNAEDISSHQMIFFLLYQETETNSSKEKLREKITQNWTGRFFQRIRAVVGLKSEAES